MPETFITPEAALAELNAAIALFADESKTLGHCFALGSDLDKVKRWRAAAQDRVTLAIAAFSRVQGQDTQRLNALHAALYFDGHGHWLPDLCVKEAQSDGAAPTLNELRAAIDAMPKAAP